MTKEADVGPTQSPVARVTSDDRRGPDVDWSDGLPLCTPSFCRVKTFVPHICHPHHEWYFSKWSLITTHLPTFERCKADLVWLAQLTTSPSGFVCSCDFTVRVMHVAGSQLDMQLVLVSLALSTRMMLRFVSAALDCWNMQEYVSLVRVISGD